MIRKFITWIKGLFKRRKPVDPPARVPDYNPNEYSKPDYQKPLAMEANQAFRYPEPAEQLNLELVTAQREEDKRVKQEIERIAHNMIDEYLMHPMKWTGGRGAGSYNGYSRCYSGNDIPVWHPIEYTIFESQVAKYEGIDLHGLIVDRYNELFESMKIADTDRREVGVLLQLRQNIG